MSNLRIKGKGSKGKNIAKPHFEINVKRCYIPDVIIVSSCPGCGQDREQDLGDQYLSYPIANDISTIYFYCENCDEEGRDCGWEEEIFLDFIIRKPEDNSEKICDMTKKELMDFIRENIGVEQ